MTIYIGNLHSKTSETDVVTLFEQYGEVSSVKIVTDKAGNRSKGFGFVRMENMEAARKAMQALDHTTYMSCRIEVSEAL